MNRLALVIIAFAVTACGGGGGASTSFSGSTTAGPTPIQIPGPGSAPTADAGSIQVVAGEAVFGQVTGRDPEGRIERFGAERQTAQGQVQFTDEASGKFVYLADVDASGTDRFTFFVQDQEGQAAHSEVVVDISPRDPELRLCRFQSVELGGWVEEIHLSPVDEDVLWVRAGTVLHATKNRGATFEVIREGVLKVLPDWSNPDHLYVMHQSSRQHVDESVDGGATWQTFWFPSGASDQARDIAIDHGGTGLWIATDQGLYRVDEIGSQTLIRPGAFRHVASSPTLPERLLASTDTELMASDDGGATVTATAVSGPHKIGFDVADPDRVYGWHRGRLLRSDDGGITWSTLLSGNNSHYFQNIVTTDAFPGELYALDFTSIKRSDDAGISWTAIMGGQHRGFVFGPAGNLYSGDDSRLICTDSFELPGAEAILAAPVSVSLELDRSEVDQGSTVQVQIRLENDGANSVESVRVQLYRSTAPVNAQLDRPLQGHGQIMVLDTVIDTLEPGTTQSVRFDWPYAAPTGSHRFTALAHGPGMTRTASVVALGVVDGSVMNPNQSSRARLAGGTVWLNVTTPFVTIETRAGEPRRVSIDIRNYGPDTARDVYLSIPNGSYLNINLESISQGRCGPETANPFVCEIGSLPPDRSVTVFAEITLSGSAANWTALPYDVVTSTPEGSTPWLTNAEIGGPEDVTVTTGELITQRVQLTNSGTDVLQRALVYGFIGPWPEITTTQFHGFDSPSCDIVGEQCMTSEDCLRVRTVVEYVCDVSNGQLGELSSGAALGYTLQLTLQNPTSAHHVIALHGDPNQSASGYGHRRTLELAPGDNVAVGHIEVVE